MRATSSGSEVIASPWIANSGTIVNSSPQSVIGGLWAYYYVVPGALDELGAWLG
jgi:hypothetical protein